jgi:hypothetical protein
LAACPEGRGGALGCVAWRHDAVHRLWFGDVRHEAVQRETFEFLE